jgi:pimeloyl-ACP methyl ester carboxylesterase
LPVIEVNNINIYYASAGQGEALIMLMGLGADHSGWNSQVPFFKKYYRVIAPDNRGVGKSDKPKGPYSITMMADDTLALMKALNIEKAHIMGESMGGMIAQEIAINYPQRVRKLVLVSTYARDDQSSSGSTSELFKEVQTTGKVGSSLINLAFNKPLNRVFVKVMARINSTFTKGSVKKVNKVGFDVNLKPASNITLWTDCL